MDIQEASVSKPRQRTRRLAEFEIRILERTLWKTKNRPSEEDFIELAGKLKNLRLEQIRTWFKSRQKNKPRRTKLGVGVSSYRRVSGSSNIHKNDEIESSDRTIRPKDRRKCVKDSSSSPSEIIVDDEEEAPRIQENNISSTSDGAEECKGRLDEQNNDDGEANPQIIELKMMKNEIIMQKAELETQKIEINGQEIELTRQANELTWQANELTRQANELTRQANELKKRKLLVTADELKLCLKISKINDKIKLLK